MFERYTEQARRAIFYARYEASCQPAKEITTAHILIGLTRDTGSRADRVGSLTEHTARLRTELAIPCPPKNTQGRDLMSDMRLNHNSKLALAYAAQEAGLDDSIPIIYCAGFCDSQMKPPPRSARSRSTSPPRRLFPAATAQSSPRRRLFMCGFSAPLFGPIAPRCSSYWPL
jgi:hypothetical protein